MTVAVAGGGGHGVAARLTQEILEVRHEMEEAEHRNRELQTVNRALYRELERSQASFQAAASLPARAGVPEATPEAAGEASQKTAAAALAPCLAAMPPPLNDDLEKLEDQLRGERAWRKREREKLMEELEEAQQGREASQEELRFERITCKRLREELETAERSSAVFLVEVEELRAEVAAIQQARAKEVAAAIAERDQAVGERRDALAKLALARIKAQGAKRVEDALRQRGAALEADCAGLRARLEAVDAAYRRALEDRGATQVEDVQGTDVVACTPREAPCERSSSHLQLNSLELGHMSARLMAAEAGEAAARAELEAAKREVDLLSLSVETFGAEMEGLRNCLEFKTQAVEIMDEEVRRLNKQVANLVALSAPEPDAQHVALDDDAGSYAVTELPRGALEAQAHGKGKAMYSLRRWRSARGD